jgi:hypothetical protein
MFMQSCCQLNEDFVMRRIFILFLFIVLAAAGSSAHAEPPAWRDAPSVDSPFSMRFDPSRVLIRIDPATRWGLFRESDVITVRLPHGSTIRVMDWRGNVVYSGVPGRLSPLPVGHYFVETAGDRNQFAVLPGDYHGASFFGTDADLGDDPGQTARVDSVDPQVVRAGFLWSRVQPAPDVWNWEPFDRIVAVNSARHRKIIAVATIRPDWMTDDSEFVARYTEYVKRIARRYGSKIEWLEVWNEIAAPASYAERLPYSNSFDAMLRSYVKLLKGSREAVRSVSKIQVAGPAWQNPYWSDDTAKLMALGAKDLLDGFSYHDYMMPQAAPDRDTIPAHVMVPRIDRRVANFRSSTGNLPEFVDEVGLYGRSALGTVNTGLPEFQSNLSWQQGVWRAIKYVVMYRAAGVQVLIPHVFPMGTSDAQGNLEINGWDMGERGPHPKTSAFLMACYWLNGAGPIQQKVIDDQIFLYGWSRPDGHVLVMAWCIEGHSAKLRPAETFKISDIYGQAIKATLLGPEPTLFNPSGTTSVQGAMDAVAAMIQPGD